ncbi:alpha/beta fold hydrolase [Leptolyngbya sp. BC1307]|uniref:alpha/beta fold hydrolase n=1 Tax=Leptolyngbya sp. BC1307 TaxID=2029589 RepID=UPI001F0AF689|nr:alpha/beta fold hydrolase [Leptolyngbya sp. BC1307]
MRGVQMGLPVEAAGLSEADSVAIAQQVQWANVQMPAGPVATSYICSGQGIPVLLLHGFDSSLFEFRRLVPLLAEPAQAHHQVYAMDLLGFGFGDRLAAQPVDPAAIKQHLLAFCQQVIGQAVVLVGASMGGGVAIDFAVSYPEAVKQLVLIDAVGFAAGPAIGKVMFSPLDRWATNFLRNPGVRRKISEKAYYDRTFVTPDAELCASLHLLMPRWQEALIAFTKSGGYNFLSKKIPQVKVPTRVLWGRQDQILGVKDATRFERTIPHCQLVWIENCGHVPHLEKPQETAAHIADLL